jgi:hypothetical protein
MSGSWTISPAWFARSSRWTAVMTLHLPEDRLENNAVHSREMTRDVPDGNALRRRHLVQVITAP